MSSQGWIHATYIFTAPGRKIIVAHLDWSRASREHLDRALGPPPGQPAPAGEWALMLVAQGSMPAIPRAWGRVGRILTFKTQERAMAVAWRVKKSWVLRRTGSGQ